MTNKPPENKQRQEDLMKSRKAAQQAEINRSNTAASEELKNMFEAAEEIKLETVAPNEKKELISKARALTIIKNLADTLGCPPTLALVGVCLLFQKGAANKGTSNSLEVQVIGEGGRLINITKNDLLYAYQKQKKNFFLRRLTETLSTEISSFYEKHGLNGDLS
jgi:hypothetical protein